MSSQLLETIQQALSQHSDVLPQTSSSANVPLTLSADVRNSGYKIAPIDLNLFPAGWHNLCSGVIPKAGQVIQAWAQENAPQGKNVLVLAEFMTRNAPYAQNLQTIGQALNEGGFEVTFGTLNPEMSEAQVAIETMAGDTLSLQKVDIEADQLMVAGQSPDWVLCNNDFTQGLPDGLVDVKTPIFPSPTLGWHNRKKSNFFRAYQEVATQAATQLNLDPWQIIPDTVAISDVDFWNQTGLDPVAQAVDAMLERIAKNYQQRGIRDTPFVVVKDEAGTFGMGVLSLESSDMIRNPNRKTRQKMQRGKSGRPIQSVLVQEGIYTRDLINECVAEPVVMASAGHMLGGFFRYHCSRDETENLNAKGMVFARLCAGTADGGPCPEDCIRDDLRYNVYGWFAELSALAAAAEIAAA